MTIMSYLDQDMNPTIAADYAIPITPMVADWIVFERLYGPSRAYSGDTVWGFGTNGDGRLACSAYADGGTNAFTLTRAATTGSTSGPRAQRVDLRPEQVFDVGGRIGNMGIARGTGDRDCLASADAIMGNDAANRLARRGGQRLDRAAGRTGWRAAPATTGSSGATGPTGCYGEGQDRLIGGAGSDI